MPTRARRLPADERKRRIIESARGVFAASNYWKVSTADLARAADISEPALYRYFPSKKDIFLCTIKTTAPKLLDSWQRVAEEVDDPLETLWSIGVGYYDHLKSHSAVMKLQFQALVEADDPDIRKALHENFSSFVDFFAEILEDGKRRGSIRDDVDVRACAWHFLGMGLTLDTMHLSISTASSHASKWRCGYASLSIACGLTCRKGVFNRWGRQSLMITFRPSLLRLKR